MRDSGLDSKLVFIRHTTLSDEGSIQVGKRTADRIKGACRGRLTAEESADLVEADAEIARRELVMAAEITALWSKPVVKLRFTKRDRLARTSCGAQPLGRSAPTRLEADYDCALSAACGIARLRK
jgi:hypothetical protein